MNKITIKRYRQYDLRRQTDTCMNMTCWLDNDSLDVGWRVKIGGQPWWWEITARYSVIKETRRHEDIGVFDGGHYEELIVDRRVTRE